MKPFVLLIQNAETRYTRSDVLSFVAADNSGQFGVLAGAEPLLASLRFGLARFKPVAADWHYVALPSGVLAFDGKQLVITTTHFLVDTQRDAMANALTREIANAEQAVVSARRMITDIEHALMKKLWEMGRQSPDLELPL